MTRKTATGPIDPHLTGGSPTDRSRYIFCRALADACARQPHTKPTVSAVRCRSQARRVCRFVVFCLEATGSVTYGQSGCTHVKLCRARGHTSMTSKGRACYGHPLGASPQDDLRCSLATYVAQLLLQSRLNLIALTTVDLLRSSLLSVAGSCVSQASTNYRLLNFSYRSYPPGCLWNEVWWLLSCCEAHTAGQPRDSECCC